jgi:hypothetical protein
MSAFFTIIYIKPNRLSHEKIAIGMLANSNGLPEFHYADYKLSFALKQLKTDQSRAIRKSLQLLENDVNKYINGETSVPMFDEPYAKKILSKLALKKRGILIYSDLISIEKPITFAQLFAKYISKEGYQTALKQTASRDSIKKRFNNHIAHRRYQSFEAKKWLNDTEFPLLAAPVQVDLFRRSKGLTVFKVIDFNLTEKTVQQHIATFRMLVESLNLYALNNGLSKGRYYLVYETPKSEGKLELVNKIKKVYTRFELIKMSEMADKI